MVFFGRDLSSFQISGVRIFVLSLINGGRHFLLLLLSPSNRNKHLILKAVEPIMIWLIVLPLSWRQFLVFRPSAIRPLAVVYWLVVVLEIPTLSRGNCVFGGIRWVMPALVKNILPRILFFTYFWLLDPLSQIARNHIHIYLIRIFWIIIILKFGICIFWFNTSILRLIPWLVRRCLHNHL